MPTTPLLQRCRLLPPSDHHPLLIDTNLDMARSYSCLRPTAKLNTQIQPHPASRRPARSDLPE